MTPSEKLYFLKKAREAIIGKGYPAGEDLFYFCYFNTMKERLRGINTRGGEGFMRVLLVEGKKEVEDTIKLYEERLEEKKQPVPDHKGYEFIEYFSGLEKS